ncbi:signal transduction histidine kinase [Inhella inkyongensis]|uniref:histidine kinase n=1 Tax=Inhella inkyongensis TaxID=392593 RepID=A0A840RWL5_9BURK|nr:hybrid sensor histidine kinase/response regulator [Inhella inkyongensis]MBB5203087.1 signal transduction histidine kinase [Inhella inkyongensis]
MAEAGGPAKTDAALEESIRREIVAALFRNLPHSLVVGVVFTGIFAWMFYGRVDTRELAAWGIGMGVATVHGALCWRAFRRADSQPDWDSRLHLRAYGRQTWLVGFFLGLSGWLFYAPEFGELRWVAVLMLLSFAAGLVALLALHLPLYYAWLALMSVPLALRFAVSGAPGGWAGGALFAFFIVGIVPYAQRQGRIVQETTRIRHTKAELVTQLQRTTQQLAEAHEAKSRFFAAASHDLRQPVQAIRYYAELLQPQGADIHTVDRIRQCVASLDGLLEGVLTLSRLDAGKVHKRVFAVDLVALAERLRQLYEGEAASRGLRLRVRAPTRAWAMSDSVHLERVLGNLLANALRYTPTGGVLLAVRRRGAHWGLQVCDTGIGIAPEFQADVFDEFVQLGPPQHDVNQGVGLGLATVRRLCALLEHPLTLRSRVGHGTVFTLQVPACEPPLESDPDERAERAPSALLRGRVLVVEDNLDVRESLARMLERWGLHCETCADASEALLRWRAAPPDGRFEVVLSDWRLPGVLNGVQLIEALRQEPGAPACCFVLVTGETEDSIDSVPVDVQLLRKPVRPIRLRALLSTVLRPERSL